MLMMNLTQINRRKRCVNIPRSKKTLTTKSISVEDARSHTNTITKHARTQMMSLHAKCCYEHSYFVYRHDGTYQELHQHAFQSEALMEQTSLPQLYMDDSHGLIC